MPEQAWKHVSGLQMQDAVGVIVERGVFGPLTMRGVSEEEIREQQEKVQ